MNSARNSGVGRFLRTIGLMTWGCRLTVVLMFVVGMPAFSRAASVVTPAGPKSGGKPVTAKRPSTGAKTNPLEAVIRRMRSAGKRIGQQEIGPETRDLQQQVVRDLQTLIDQVRNGQARQNRSPQSSSAAKPRPSAGHKRPQSAAQSAAGGGKSRNGKSRQSTNRQQATTAPDHRILERRMLVKELWGHLPPALRQRLLNIEGATPLPQYEQLVRRYFESLAGQDARKPSP